jgi:lysophospholipase L1-like esterase
MIRASSLTLLALATLSGTLRAQTTASTPPPKPAPVPAGLNLQDGDRFIFIGDSITHQCLYTQFVENFYFTRFPDRRIHFRNAGVSGDKAADALNRFDDDIARFKPTVATVLLGMNDGSYKDFDPAIFETYRRDMTTLLDKLDALQCRVFLMGPTMFDHQAWDIRVKEKPDYARGRNVTGYNAVLAYYSAWLRETARQRGYGYIDLFSPLNNLTDKGRLTDKNFTLIADAIHPDAPGQQVMAHTLIETLGEPRAAGQLLATATPKGWQLRSATATLGQPAGDTRSLTFDLLPKSLPWTVIEEAAPGYKLAVSGHKLSSESFTLSGLQPGRYDLVIGGQTVGTWDSHALARRVEIQEDPDSPTHQQAARVAALNKQRNDEAIRPLRNLYGQRKGKLRAAGTPEGKAAFAAWLPEFQKQRDELEAKAKAFEDQIYQANQPQKILVETKPAAKPAAGKPAPAAKTPAQ